MATLALSSVDSLGVRSQFLASQRKTAQGTDNLRQIVEAGRSRVRGFQNGSGKPVKGVSNRVFHMAGRGVSKLRVTEPESESKVVAKKGVV